MKFEKINYIVLEMSCDEFDQLMGILEIGSENKILLPQQTEDYLKEAKILKNKIIDSMNKKEN